MGTSEEEGETNLEYFQGQKLPRKRHSNIFGRQG